MNSFKSERIVVTRSPTGNGAARPNHIGIRVEGGLIGVGAHASVGRFAARSAHAVEATAHEPSFVARASSPPSIGILSQGRDPLELEAAEQRRWLMWLGPPFVLEALSVGLVFGTGKEWCLALGVASIFATVLLLMRLILGSDVNTLRDSATVDVIERAAPVTAATGVVGAPR